MGGVDYDGLQPGTGQFVAFAAADYVPSVATSLNDCYSDCVSLPVGIITNAAG